MAGLIALRALLSRRELELVDIALLDAEAWILSRPPYGAGPPGRSGFTNKGVKGSVARIDVAIFRGWNVAAHVVRAERCRRTADAGGLRDHLVQRPCGIDEVVDDGCSAVGLPGLRPHTRTRLQIQ